MNIATSAVISILFIVVFIFGSLYFVRKTQEHAVKEKRSLISKQAKRSAAKRLQLLKDVAKPDRTTEDVIKYLRTKR